MPNRERSAFMECLNWARVVLTGCIFALGLCDLGGAVAQPPKTPDPKKAVEKGKKPAQPVDDLQIDPVKLPKDWNPPKKELEIMALEAPLITTAERDRLQREWQKFSTVRQNCDSSEAGKKVVAASIRYRLGSMTLIKHNEMRDNPNKMLQIRQELLREIANIGAAGKSPATIASMAELVNNELLKQIPELLKNNFYVRLNAVLILSEMDYRGAPIPVPAYDLLLQVVQAKDIRDDSVNGQPEAIKIDAVKGLTRLLRFSNCSVKDKTIIANAIVNQLADKNANWWLQMRMIELLRYCGISGVDAGNNNKPFVIECLLSIVKDEKRDLRVRSKACYALGRVPIPGSVKPDDIVTAIAELALHLANRAAAEPNDPIWKGCFWDIYTAFHTNHRNKDKDRDMDAEGKREGGLLVSAKAAAEPAYKLIVPIVSQILNDKSPDAASIKNLTDFVRSRQPPIPTRQ